MSWLKLVTFDAHGSKGKYRRPCEQGYKSIVVQNNISELFHLLSFLEPEKFGGGLAEIQEEFSHLEEAAQVAVFVALTALDSRMA